ncbi:MAG: MMPL family transporter [Candidatus Delongbacteria bacterium]|nr:MMPL family transporter [Candidatus Delongbacteria bacterium]
MIGISVYGLKKVRVESSFDNYFVEDDPVLIQTDEFKAIFGNDNFVAVLTRCDDSFSRQSLELIRELSNELMDSISYADKITSLTDIEFITGTEEGMTIEQIVPDEIPAGLEELEAIRKKAYSKPNIARRLISKDGKLSWILLKLRPFPEDSVWKQINSSMAPEYCTGMEAERIICKPKYAPINPQCTGMPYLSYKKQIFFNQESAKILGLALLVAIVVLGAITRSIRGILLPLITSAGSVIMVYGITGFVGYTIDSGLVSVPILLSFAIGMAYNIHLYNYFRRRYHDHGSRYTAIVESIREMGWPVLFSALTTMAALITFLAVPVRPLHFLGVATSSCVLLSFIIVIFLMPSFFSFGRDIKPEKLAIKQQKKWMDGWLSRISEGLLRRSVTVTIVFGIVILIAILGLIRLEPAFDVEKTMGRKIPYVKTILSISDTELGSLYSYDLMIDLKENGLAKKVENLKKLEAITAFVEEFELTKRTTSILDIIKDMNQTLNENNPEYYSIPNSDDETAQLLLLYENAGGSETEYWMDYDYRRLRLMVEIATYNSSEAERELRLLQEHAAALFPGAEVTAVGSLPQFTVMMQYVVRGQILSLLMSMAIIMILLMIVFGSVRVGLIGMIPNITPALAVGGVMGWLGIPLDMMTATIMPMILGIAVDDTIHFINHAHLEFNRTADYIKTISTTFLVVGSAMVLSTGILCVNFGMYMVSIAKNYFNLGLISLIGMLAALLADVLITPILIKWCRVFGNEK